MSAPLYFLPNVHGANPEHLDRAGLASFNRDGNVEFADTQCGPNDQPGLLIRFTHGDNRDTSWELTDQLDWHAAAADPRRELPAGRYHVGINPESPPDPEDLAYRSTFPGNLVVLHDMQQWLVPIASELPHTYGVDVEGGLVRTIVEQYREFYERAAEIEATVFAEFRQVDFAEAAGAEIPAETTIAAASIEDGWRFVIEALALNYRLDADLVTHLRLLDERAALAVMCTVIEFPQIEATRLKKNAERSLEIPVGGST